MADYSGEGTLFVVGPGVTRAAHGRPYERSGDDPISRPLRIFTLDPAVSRLDGAVAVVHVPYEPLDPGPVGAVFAVDNYDGWQDLFYRQAHLDDPKVLMQHGRDPSPTDPRFHQQMVYAVCSLVYAAFRSALGRHIAWGFDRQGSGATAPHRLLLRPFAGHDRNAYYDKQRGELCFGYFRAESQVLGRNLPGGFVFTALSHDIIAHEVTHALLDGLRTQFALPTGPDAVAFHEAFADLVAIFQHFSYEQVLRASIRQSGGQIEKAALLTSLATQFGHTTGAARPLRSAIDVPDAAHEPRPYGTDSEPHARGSVLVSAIFEAFSTVFKRKIEPYVRLATHGSGLLPAGELPPDLQSVLADKASQLARQFLTVCVRAIDYCPPVDVEFGEFLRAVISADYDLVPHDEWGYREAWIDAFRRRYIYPRDVASLSEDALRWRPPSQPLPIVQELSFAALKFQGDPACPAGPDELRRQACALGRLVTRPAYLQVFGCARPGDPRLGTDAVDLPCIQSIRSSRRVGPDGQVVFDLVAEVTQRRTVQGCTGSEGFDLYGGATVILSPTGAIRYTIVKSVLNEERLERQRAFMCQTGRRFWALEHGQWQPKPLLFKLFCGQQTDEQGVIE